MAAFGSTSAGQTASFQNPNRRAPQWLDEALIGPLAAYTPKTVERTGNKLAAGAGGLLAVAAVIHALRRKRKV